MANVLGLQDEKAIVVYDPIHTITEQNIIRLLGFNCEPREHNLEGKYSLKEKDSPDQSEGIIFYLPHCPKQLTNNILWANWDRDILGNSFGSESSNKLKGLHILGNSFERVTTTQPDRILR